MSEDPATPESGRPARPDSWYRSLNPLGRQRFHVALGLALALIALGIIYLNSSAVPDGVADPALPKSRSTVLNATLLVLLLATSPAWVRWAYVPSIEVPPRIGRPISKLSIAFLLGALALATCLRLPLIDRPIQPAELDPLRLSIHGYSEVQDEASEQWRPASWEQAMNDKLPLLSLSAKASLELWRRSTGLADDRYDMVPIRLPSLLAGLASIFLAWRILHWFGYRCAALFAGFFLAIHPAAIDLDVQASGESLSHFFAMGAIASAYLALRTLKWRYWSLYGANILLCLCANPGARYFAVGTGCFVTLYLLRRILRARTRPAAWPQLVRFVVASLIAAMALIQINSPATNQASGAAAEYSAGLSSGTASGWLSSAWCYLSAGAPLTMQPTGQAEEPDNPERRDKKRQHKPAVDPHQSTIVTRPIPVWHRPAPAWQPIYCPTDPRRCRGYPHRPRPLSTHQPTCPPQSYQIICAWPAFLLPFSIGIASLSEFLPSKTYRPYFTLVIGAAYLFLFSALTWPHGRRSNSPEPARWVGSA